MCDLKIVGWGIRTTMEVGEDLGVVLCSNSDHLDTIRSDVNVVLYSKLEETEETLCIE